MKYKQPSQKIEFMSPYPIPMAMTATPEIPLFVWYLFFFINLPNLKRKIESITNGQGD